MSYAIYKTKAVILRIIPQGEANLDVVFFTQELGKITARVQSARMAHSKMRMFLSRFRLVTIDLVRGKLVWRLTGITGDPVSPLYQDENKIRVLYRVMQLTDFLVQGESPESNLFQFFEQLYDFLIHEQDVSYEKSRGLELVNSIELLRHLGYWNGMSLGGLLIGDAIAQCLKQEKELIQQINESISASQIVI